MEPEPAPAQSVKPCPFCGEMILARPRNVAIARSIWTLRCGPPRPYRKALTACSFLEGTAASAIAAGYLGLFSVLPFFGLLAIYRRDHRPAKTEAESRTCRPVPGLVWRSWSGSPRPCSGGFGRHDRHRGDWCRQRPTAPGSESRDLRQPLSGRGRTYALTDVIRIDGTADEAEDRFARFRLIGWWDQKRLDRARVLVIGAGALGNEIVKNLALLGVGRVFIADRDRVENSNLSRSILFREDDCGPAEGRGRRSAGRGDLPGDPHAAFLRQHRLRPGPGGVPLGRCDSGWSGQS